MNQRIIKFRAWDKERKEMHETWLIKWDAKGIERVAGFWNDGQYNGASDLHDFELMQFTGLYDKNGKEIFEGDIVKISGSKGEVKIREVKWMNTFWGSGFYSIENPAFTLNEYHPHETHEVIGNIYENPELLK